MQSGDGDKTEVVPAGNDVFFVKDAFTRVTVQHDAAGQPKFEIFASAPAEFFLKVVDAQITFLKDASGIVTQLILHQGGRDMPGKKVKRSRMAISAPKVPSSIATEKKTVAAMVRIYCAEHHAAADPLCATCAALERYSHARLDACPYGADKPTCRECPIHCYKPAEREAMREVMRFAGPRMLLRHPWLSAIHLWKERFRRTPTRKKK